MMGELCNHIYGFTIYVCLVFMFCTAASLQHEIRITRFQRTDKVGPLKKGHLNIDCGVQCARRAGCHGYLLDGGRCQLKMSPFQCEVGSVCFIDAAKQYDETTTSSPHEITSSVEDTQSTSTSPTTAKAVTTVAPTTAGKTTTIEETTTILPTTVEETTTIEESTTVLPTTMEDSTTVLPTTVVATTVVATTIQDITTVHTTDLATTEVRTLISCN